MCRAIADDASFNVIEMDAASNNSVDDIRNVIDQAAYTPTEGKKKVFIIDEVHMLSTAAFNALLKTLEEPPEYVIFILCTTEPDRCRRPSSRAASAMTSDGSALPPSRPASRSGGQGTDRRRREGASLYRRGSGRFDAGRPVAARSVHSV